MTKGLADRCPETVLTSIKALRRILRKRLWVSRCGIVLERSDKQVIAVNKPSFSDLAYRNKKKVTRKQRFLGRMDDVLPWELLLEPILKKYPKSRKGRRPIPARVMLRIYLMQQWYGLSDPAMEESLYDIESMRRFAGVSMQRVPDETTICKFRRFLVKHKMSEELFRFTKQHLSARGLAVSRGKIIDPRVRRTRRKHGTENRTQR